MRATSIFRKLIGITSSVVEDIRMVGEAVVVSVRLNHRQRDHCGICRRRCPRYDAGQGRRRWRGLDLGTTRVYLEAEAPRVLCPRHGVRVAAVPWAEHDARFTRAFEEQVAWLAVETSKQAVCELMRISWATVGAILTRVQRRLDHGPDRLRGVRRIGIDEISYRRGQRYLTVVLDHDSGRLLWAAEGRHEATLLRFFDELGAKGCGQITHVSADAANWIASAVEQRCPNAVRCMDPFHVVAWASMAIDEIRRQLWNQARRQDPSGRAPHLQGLRWTLLKDPQNLTEAQRSQLTLLEKSNRSLFRAYLLKEELRTILSCPYPRLAIDRLQRWLTMAFNSSLDPIIRLATTIADHIEPICNTLIHHLSNARVEALNTRIRLITRRAFGFHSHQPLIALAMLSFGDSTPALPGRHA